MSPGVEAAKTLRPVVDRANAQSREWQADQIRRTGFATPQAELGHAIALALRGAGYPHTVAHVGAQLGAVASSYNWQGTARIGQIIGRHKRTVQRARKRLEADGLIVSELRTQSRPCEGAGAVSVLPLKSAHAAVQ